MFILRLLRSKTEGWKCRGGVKERLSVVLISSVAPPLYVFALTTM